jgi:hypothetical protein
MTRDSARKGYQAAAVFWGHSISEANFRSPYFLQLESAVKS